MIYREKRELRKYKRGSSRLQEKNKYRDKKVREVKDNREERL